MYQIFASWMFYFMSAHFLILFILIIKNFKHFNSEFKKIKPTIWICLIIIFLFGFILRNSEYWRGPFSDGYTFEDSAQSWIYHGYHDRTCMVGNQENCVLHSRAMSLPGYPYLIALVDLVFGIDTINASIVSAILSSLTIVLVFFIAYLLFNSGYAGLISSAIFTFIPLNIIQSQTGLSRPTGLFFVGLALLFYLLAVKNNSLITWLAAIFSFSYAVYVRQETIALGLILFSFMIVFKFADIKKYIKEIIGANFKKKNTKIALSFILLMLILICLLSPAIIWFLADNPFNVHSKGGASGDGIWGLYHKGFLLTGKAIFQQFFNYSPLWPKGIFHYNFFISVFFLIGLILIFIKQKKNGFFILSVFLLYFSIYSFMFDGNLFGTNKLTDGYVRRSLMLHLPYSILSGYAIYIFFRLFKNYFKFIVFFALMIFTLTAGMFFKINIPLLNYPDLRNIFSEYSSFYIPRTLFADSRDKSLGLAGINDSQPGHWMVASELPDNCMIISYNNLVYIDSKFKDKNLKSIHISYFQSDIINIIEDELAKYDCIIYVEDNFCFRAKLPWQDPVYPCWFIKNKFINTYLFSIRDLRVYRSNLVD